MTRVNSMSEMAFPLVPFMPVAQSQVAAFGVLGAWFSLPNEKFNVIELSSGRKRQ